MMKLRRCDLSAPPSLFPLLGSGWRHWGPDGREWVGCGGPQPGPPVSLIHRSWADRLAPPTGPAPSPHPGRVRGSTARGDGKNGPGAVAAPHTARRHRCRHGNTRTPHIPAVSGDTTGIRCAAGQLTGALWVACWLPEYSRGSNGGPTGIRGSDSPEGTPFPRNTAPPNSRGHPCDHRNINPRYSPAVADGPGIRHPHTAAVTPVPTGVRHPPYFRAPTWPHRNTAPPNSGGHPCPR